MKSTELINIFVESARDTMGKNILTNEVDNTIHFYCEDEYFYCGDDLTDEDYN